MGHRHRGIVGVLLGASLLLAIAAPVRARSAPDRAAADRAIARPAAADSAAVPDTSFTRTGARMVDTVTVLPPVRVEDSRPDVSGRQTATTVRLDRSKLVRFLPGTAGDALLGVPGVDLVKTGPWASRVSVRGLAGDRVLMLVDGVRVNGVRGHGAQSSLVAVDRLESVELEPGASSAQYGSDALGGVIRFATHRPLLDREESAQLTIQTRGSMPDEGWSQSARVRVTGRRLGFELGGGLGGLDGLVTPEGRVANSGNREQNFAARAVTRLAGTLVDFEHARNAAYDVGLPAFSDDNGSTGVYPLQARDLDRLELSRAGDGWAPESRLLAVVQQARNDFDETTVAPVTRFGRPIGSVTTEADDRVRTRAVSFAPSFHWARGGGLRVSGEYRHEKTNGPRATTATTRTSAGVPTDTTYATGESMPPARRDAWSAAVFAAPVVRGFRIESGVRWDALHSHADSTEVSTTPKLDVGDRRVSAEAGLARSFGGVEPYLHFATGFRAPNLEERYYHDEIHGGMTVYGNPDLVSERSVSTEAGLRVRGVGALHEGRVSAYRSDVEDLISIQYFDMLYGRPRFEYRNVREARLEGIESAIQFHFGAAGLGLHASAPRAINRETGERLIDAGAARGTVDLTLPLPRWVPGGALSLRWRWNDAVRTADTTIARPAFSTTALEVSAVLSGFRTVLAVRNLWNHSYREPLSFIPEPGRTLVISIRRDLAFALPFLRKDS